MTPNPCNCGCHECKTATAHAVKTVETMAPTAEELAVIRQEFDHLDTDCTGYIQGAELKQLLASQLGRPPTAEETAVALQQHDVDLDGQISFDEYVSWVYSSGAGPSSLAPTGSPQDDAELIELASQVRAADDACRAVKRRDYGELKAFCNPPKCTALTALAAKILIDKRDAAAGSDADGMTFGSSTTIVLVCWCDQSTRKMLKERVIDGVVDPATIAELDKMMVDNCDWTCEKTGMSGGPAAAAVCKYIFAVVAFCKRAARLGLELGRDGQVQVPCTW